MNADLDAFLQEAEGRRFRDGTWDCSLMVAAWVKRVTGIDGASPWRGRYSTRLGWLRILKREGGIESVIAKGAALAGLAETSEPKRGDIGVARQPNGELMAGICLGRGWASAGPSGLATVVAQPVRVWRVEPPQTSDRPHWPLGPA